MTGTSMPVLPSSRQRLRAATRSRARVDEHGVVRARVEQRGHLGGGRAHTVRQERQCGQHRSGFRISGQQKEFHSRSPLTPGLHGGRR